MADVMIAHASISENGTSGWDGKAKAGDQTKKEVCKRKWYNKPWDCVIRAKNPDMADKIALYAEQCAENDNIGYDQSQRNTLWNQWQQTKDFTKVGKCECDCSSLVAVCSIAAGAHIYYGNNAPRTATMEKVYRDCGDFDIIKHSDYTTKSDYLHRGDILVKAGSHTVVVISNGAKIDAPVIEKPAATTETDLEKVARDVIKGKYGNYPNRKKNLEDAGYDYLKVQVIVNKLKGK